MPRTSRRLVEGRIEELRLILGSARVIEDGEVLTDMVGVGSIVRVKDLENSDDWEWTIVGTFEPTQRRTESPTSLRWARL